MPTYRYHCEKCGKKFERTETISEHDEVNPQCTKCGSKKVTFCRHSGEIALDVLHTAAWTDASSRAPDWYTGDALASHASRRTAGSTPGHS
jgi:putative FmdB family regulatory protein